MKNLFVIVLVMALSVIGIWLTLLHVDDKYQSVIAVAISTVSVQTILFILKPWIDKGINRHTKTFGVIYDKKFLVYNELVTSLIDSRSLFLFFIQKPAEVKEKVIFEKIVGIKKKILHNRLVMSVQIFDEITEQYNDIFTMYEAIINNIDSSGNMTDLNLPEKIKEILASKAMDLRLKYITDLMKKDLDIK